MDKKKGIIAIVLFVFLGLMVFSFAANPDDGITELEDSDKTSVNQLANTGSDDAEASLVSTTEENDDDDNNTLTVVQSSGTNSSSNNSSSTNNSAIVPSTNTSNQLGENISNQTEDYSSVIAMVEKIEEQIKSANTINAARTDYESVRNTVESVEDENVQKSLNERLNEVFPIINDTTAPEVLVNREEVKENAIYNGNVVIKVNDDTATTTKSITLDGKEIDNVEKLVDGVYKITIVDAAFNETTITFTYDNTAPKPHSTTYSTSEPTNGSVVVTIRVNEELKEVEGWTLSEDKKAISKSFDENINGNVTISDLAGNEVKRYYSIKNIDKVAPTAKVSYSNTNEKGDLYSTNKDVTVTLVTEEKIQPINGWVEVELGYKYTITHSQSGKYSVVITDLAGNQSTIKYEVKRLDKVAPELTIIPNTNRIRHEVNTPFVDPGYNAYDIVDKNVTNLVKVSYRYNNKGNWENVNELDTSKLGEYVITYTAYDKNGNSTSKTRAVTIQDTTAATIVLPSQLGLNKNEMRVESGIKVELKDVIAEAIDNYDETKKIEPYRADLLISNVASENTYDYDFSNGFDTRYVGRYNIYYKVKDSSGNESTATLLLVMKDTTAPTIELKGTEGRNNNEYRVVQDTIVTLKDLTAKATDNVDDDKTLEPASIKRYYPKETGKSSHAYDASNGFDTSSVGYYEIKYEAKDSSGNKSTKTMLLVVNAKKAPQVENGEINLSSNLKLTNESFYNDNITTEEIVIDGNGHTVNQEITSTDRIKWIENGTKPVLSYMFSSANGAKITVNDVKFTGTVNSILLGNYRSATYNNYNTELNNVDVIGLKVVSLSPSVAPAVIVYGKATLNNTNIYGTTRSSLETEEDVNWPIYDLTPVNYSTTVVNGGKIGSIYTWAKAALEINSAEIDTIISACRKTSDFKTGGLVIGADTKVNKIVVNNKNAVITIKAGATVETLDFNGLSQDNMTINIEDGATVNNIVY